MRALLALLGVELVLSARRGESLLITLVVPVALLLFFASAMPAPTDGRDLLDFLVPGVLALALMSTSMVSLGISTAFERYYGVLKRLVGSPLPRRTLLAAKTLAVLVVQLVQVVLIAGIAVPALGWQPAGSAAVGAVVLLVGSVAFAGLGLLMAGTLRAEATLAIANGLYLLFLLLGGFVFPVDQLPPVVAAVARLLPASAFSEATRFALAGPVEAALTPLAVLAAWALAACSAAALTFRAE